MGPVHYFSQFCETMLAVWTFRCYVSPSGRDAIDDWYGRQPAGVQGAFDVALEYLSQRPREEWRRPEFDLLSGKFRDLGEIRFKADKQYRILGFFGPRPSEFTLLIGASKKGQNYDPRSALDTALSRRSEVLLLDGRNCRVCTL
jgi:hypothetical protein